VICGFEFVHCRVPIKHLSICGRRFPVQGRACRLRLRLSRLRSLGTEAALLEEHSRVIRHHHGPPRRPARLSGFERQAGGPCIARCLRRLCAAGVGQVADVGCGASGLTRRCIPRGVWPRRSPRGGRALRSAGAPQRHAVFDSVRHYSQRSKRSTRARRERQRPDPTSDLG
jgi:hypothetical protein